MPLLSSLREPQGIAFIFPLLVIHGDHDVLIPIDRSKEIKAAVPSAQFVELKGAGHMPMMEFALETSSALKMLK